jgi:hypothetical protein
MAKKHSSTRKPPRTIAQRMADLDAKKKKLEIRQQIDTLRQQLKGTRKG